jgi:hypothetical protein
MLTLDHIAVSTTALDRRGGRRGALGLPLAPGGQHAAMGTWNRLLSLGPEEYFELIAIEPGAPGPRSRAGSTWTISLGPRGRPHGFAAATTLTPPWPWHPRHRHAVVTATGDLSWRMAIPEPANCPFDGLFPALIEWEGTAHPAPRIPDKDVRLKALELHSPSADGLRAALRRSSRIRASPSCPPTRPAWRPPRHARRGRHPVIRPARPRRCPSHRGDLEPDHPRHDRHLHHRRKGPDTPSPRPSPTACPTTWPKTTPAHPGFVTAFQFRGGPGYAHTFEHSIHLIPAHKAAAWACADDHDRGGSEGARRPFALCRRVGRKRGGVTFHAALGYLMSPACPRSGASSGAGTT